MFAPEGFSWSVSGGSITANSGNLIEVVASDGSCEIGVNVRGRKENCTGGISLSPIRSTTYLINIPANNRTISGDAIIAAGGSGTYTINESSSDVSSYRWRVTGDQPGWRIETFLIGGTFPVNPTGRNAFVTFDGCCFSDGTVYVRAENSCGQSLGEASFGIQAQPLLNPIVSSSSHNISPNPVAAGQTINIHASPEFSEQVAIRNENGKLMNTYEVSKERSNLSINGLARGLYFIEFRINGNVKTERLLVLD